MLRLAEIGGKGKPDHNLPWLMISREILCWYSCSAAAGAPWSVNRPWLTLIFNLVNFTSSWNLR